MEGQLIEFVNGHPPMIQVGIPHESIYTYVPEPTEQKDVPLIHTPAPHHYNAMV